MTEVYINQVKTKEQREKVFAVRREVFVIEQKVNKGEEFDEFEESSIHFLASDSKGNGVGSSRWRITDKGLKLERFAVKKEWRGKGVGSKLVEATLSSIEAREGLGNYLYLHAQLNAVPLYKKYGFVKVGEMFEECNIKHIKMERVV